jgi:SlyX protein
MAPDDRVTELEIRSAHLEKQVHELSEVLYRQQRELDTLKEIARRLQQKVGGDPGLVDAAQSDRPPHY